MKLADNECKVTKGQLFQCCDHYGGRATSIRYKPSAHIQTCLFTRRYLVMH